MKHTLFIFSIIVLSINLYGQSECSYENYHYYVSKAHFSQSDGDTLQASKYYSKAFMSINHPFGIHVAAALNNATDINDDSLALHYAGLLAKGGIPMEYFDKFKNKAWHKQLIDSFELYQIHFKQNYNMQLRKDILDLRHVDSLFNIKYHSWRKKEIELSFEELLNDAEEVFKMFKSMIKAHGFPSEKNAGYHLRENSVSLVPVTIVMHHLFQRGERVFYDQLGDLSCKGYILPIEEASLTGVRGFGKSTGIKDEMLIRWNKYRPENTPE